jgi:GMP synthase-like glutamine amidotransferase
MTSSRTSPAAESRAVPESPLVLVIEHDRSDPPLRLGEWLIEAGARLELCRPHAGDPVPQDTTGFDALISLGGEMGATDDDLAPWLPATRRLLAAAAADGTPTLGVCLGAQLLAVATGGEVRRGDDGPEIGAHLTAKRDAAAADPLFADVPMTPDVMQYHYDAITRLPPGAVLLLTGTGYPNQAFRVGHAAWGVQFHIETGAADLRSWGRGDPQGPPGTDRDRAEAGGRLGSMLDEAEESMAVVWGGLAGRFVELARRSRAGDGHGSTRRRTLTLAAMDPRPGRPIDPDPSTAPARGRFVPPAEPPGS